ncbi:MAG: UDP-N-acetylglucosamine 4,6-dehydratase (inverting) [Patescibacteria group bacterium]
MSIDFFKNKVILVTGGTGSFGKNFIRYLLENSEAKKIIIFSRDELKQSQMRAELKNDERLRFFLGDVRSLHRLQRAFNGVDIVIHAAALKQVSTIEYNPFEAVETNILGSQNVIDAAIDQGVEKVLLISTDKAVQPVNLYGSTKLCAEKLFISGNSYAGGRTKFACVRYGNVIGSRGSVVDKLLKRESVSITDERMTRFWISLDQSFKLVLFALANMEKGEIFIPKIPSMKLIDLLEALEPGVNRKIIGSLPGEKIHETLISKEESGHAIELGQFYVILSEVFSSSSEIYQKYYQFGKKLEFDFCYSSDTNKNWLTEEQLFSIIKELK